LLEKNDFDAVIEFGSGSSTLIVARALDNLRKHGKRQRIPKQIAFEHQQRYHAATSELLRRSNLLENVSLALAPLHAISVESDDSYQYYSVDQELAQLRDQLHSHACPQILTIVDGPPASVGPLSRLPALATLLQYFPHQEGFVLLDDYVREDEREIARRWQKTLTANGIESTTTEFDFEKQACLLHFKSEQRAT
jgi:hypothetical protein